MLRATEARNCLFVAMCNGKFAPRIYRRAMAIRTSSNLGRARDHCHGDGDPAIVSRRLYDSISSSTHNSLALPVAGALLYTAEISEYTDVIDFVNQIMYTCKTSFPLFDIQLVSLLLQASRTQSLHYGGAYAQPATAQALTRGV